MLKFKNGLGFVIDKVPRHMKFKLEIGISPFRERGKWVLQPRLLDTVDSPDDSEVAIAKAAYVRWRAWAGERATFAFSQFNETVV